MNKMLRTLYARARAQGYTAATAYRIATATDPLPELEWKDYDSRASFERDGFTFSVRVEPDDNADLSWVGEFTNSWETGAIKNPNYYAGQTYEWFVATYTYEERVGDLRASGRSRGVADAEARQAIQKDAAMAVDYQEYVIALSVKRAGVELTTEYLGGVGFGDSYDDNRRYVAEVIAEMLDEAIENARTTLRELCKDD